MPAKPCLWALGAKEGQEGISLSEKYEPLSTYCLSLLLTLAIFSFISAAVQDSFLFPPRDGQPPSTPVGHVTSTPSSTQF